MLSEYGGGGRGEGGGSSDLFITIGRERNWVQHGLGDYMVNSHVALTKSLRGKLSKLVLLFAKGTETCQNQTFSPPIPQIFTCKTVHRLQLYPYIVDSSRT